MKKTVIILILLSISKLIWAQNNPDFTLKISFNHSESVAGGKKIDITATPFKNGYKLLYSMRDSVRNTLLKEDSAFKGIKEELDKEISNERMTELVPSIKLLVDKYSVFTKDSVVINKLDYPNLSNLIELVKKKDEKFTSEMEKKDVRVLIGNIRFNISFYLDSKITQDYVLTTPTKDSYPLFYSLVKDLLLVYRDKASNSFLNRENTFYY